MNRSLYFPLVLAASLVGPGLLAQTPATAFSAAATSPAATGVPAPALPQAIPAKIALISFEQAVVATNEGQRAVADIQKKFEPQRSKIESQGAEINSLRQQLQALPANTPDAERASREKTLDTKEKQLQREGEDATTAYQSELQEAYGKVAQKVGQTAVKYAQDNGYTLMLNAGGNPQTPNPVLWAMASTDITQAVVNAYNASSGIAPPPPSARRTPPAAAPHK